jgi:hypothetical protein
MANFIANIDEHRVAQIFQLRPDGMALAAVNLSQTAGHTSLNKVSGGGSALLK